jgi:hypothetical protein
MFCFLCPDMETSFSCGVSDDVSGALVVLFAPSQNRDMACILRVCALGDIGGRIVRRSRTEKNVPNSIKQSLTKRKRYSRHTDTALHPLNLTRTLLSVLYPNKNRDPPNCAQNMTLASALHSSFFSPRLPPPLEQHIQTTASRQTRTQTRETSSRPTTSSTPLTWWRTTVIPSLRRVRLLLLVHHRLLAVALLWVALLGTAGVGLLAVGLLLLLLVIVGVGGAGVVVRLLRLLRVARRWVWRCVLHRRMVSWCGKADLA